MNKNISKSKFNLSDTWANAFNLFQPKVSTNLDKNTSINDSGQLFYPLDKANIFNTLSHKRSQ